MSANTYVAKSMWRWFREAVAGLAGIVVSLVGASSVMASMTNGVGFDAAPASSQVDLVVTPVHGSKLVEVAGDRGRVQLTDSKVVDGLHPGEAAYFGLTFALRGAEGQVGRVSVIPEAAVDETGDLAYEVRLVEDATKCREQWADGRVVVPRRNIAESVVDGFWLSGDDPAMPACIRVLHGKGASHVETGSIVWRFVATGA